MKPDVVLELPPGGENTRNSEGAFLERGAGRLLFAYSRFHRTATADRGGADNAPAFLAGRVSADGGRTWSERDEVIVSNEGVENVMSVSLLNTRSGAPIMVYLVKNGWHDCRPAARISPDGGESWPDRVLLEEKQGYHVVNNDRVIELSDGRLLVPAAFHPVADTPEKKRLGAGVVFVFFSDDGGRTWQRSKRPIESPVAPGTPLSRADVPAGAWFTDPEARHLSGLQEPGVIEKRDGGVYLWARTDLGRQYVAHSGDRGETWSSAAPGPLVSPCSPASIKRLPGSGWWLAVFNDHSGRFPFAPGLRTPLAAAISRDEGRTWEKHRILEDDRDGWYCYTAIHFHRGNVQLAYCAGSRSRKQGLALTRVTVTPEAWFTG